MSVSSNPKIVIDLDQTLTLKCKEGDYANVEVNPEVVKTLRKYRKDGFEIVIMTARNMRTHQGNVGKINAITLPIIIDWLNKHNIPYDEIHVGRPWCGKGGFYVDDKAIRPDEFTNMSYEEIMEII